MTLAEAYRPRTWDDLVGNHTITNSIKMNISREHVEGYSVYLFEGPNGCGKTSVAEIMGRDIIRHHHVEDRLGNPYIEYYNASDSRGIDFARELKRKLGYPYPAIFVLDEADSLTMAAQESLRVILEKKPDGKNIVLIGNDFSKFTKGIKSRCKLYSFKSLKSVDIAQRLWQIIEKEGLKINTKRDFVSEITLIVDGDLRWAINELSKIIDLDHTITDASCSILFDDEDEEEEENDESIAWS